MNVSGKKPCAQVGKKRRKLEPTGKETAVFVGKLSVTIGSKTIGIKSYEDDSKDIDDVEVRSDELTSLTGKHGQRKMWDLTKALIDYHNCPFLCTFCSYVTSDKELDILRAILKELPDTVGNRLLEFLSQELRRVTTAMEEYEEIVTQRDVEACLMLCVLLGRPDTTVTQFPAQLTTLAQTRPALVQHFPEIKTHATKLLVEYMQSLSAPTPTDGQVATNRPTAESSRHESDEPTGGFQSTTSEQAPSEPQSPMPPLERP
jgi:hypothetical protein